MTNFELIHNADIDKLSLFLEQMKVCQLCDYNTTSKCSSISMKDNCYEGIKEYLKGEN